MNSLNFLIKFLIIVGLTSLILKFGGSLLSIFIVFGFLFILGNLKKSQNNIKSRKME